MIRYIREIIACFGIFGLQNMLQIAFEWIICRMFFFLFLSCANLKAVQRLVMPGISDLFLFKIQKVLLITRTAKIIL